MYLMFLKTWMYVSKPCSGILVREPSPKQGLENRFLGTTFELFNWGGCTKGRYQRYHGKA